VRIGVVIPAFNAEQWIGKAVASVLAQSHRDWSLVVVDDGSTDDTSKVVARFDTPAIRLMRQANAGASAARNTGMTALLEDADRGSSILFLDADDWLNDDALERLAAALEGAPEAVAAIGPYSLEGRVRRANRGDLLLPLLQRNLFANGGHLLLRAEAIRSIGLFRTDIAYGEDWEYWIRLALQGPFTMTAGNAPVLVVRQHEGGAYRRLAANPASFKPCMDAIFGNPALLARLGPAQLAIARRRTEAENAWIIGRELLRHGRANEGRAWLRRSIRAAPTLKRVALLVASLLPIGPFARYTIARRWP
jgi:glycosyltransferase involved in cell wall biosynthesis